MATISWNEIRKRAIQFAHDWKDAGRENAESHLFWNGFFKVFGVKVREVALFEKAVNKLDKKRKGRIDLFWPGKLIVEQKSKGKSLDLALDQAVDYGLALPSAERPRFIIVSDFARMRLHALDFDEVIEFDLKDLPDHVDHFGFIAGYRTQPLLPEDPVNIEAAEKMGKLHDALKASGYDGHPLEVLLVRILFLLFAEDTRVFEDIRGFEEWVNQRTSPDGSDLGSKLAEAFQVLNTPDEKRSIHLDEMLARFPYVNGLLFEEALPVAQFSKKMRKLLLDACEMDWSAISPSIFGAMFQSIMDKKKRRNLGAHYTSEENILKTIGPLFLDDLWSEFDKAKRSKPRLKKLHKKLRRLKFLDPACGCGNFLVVAYRELRLLELEILRQLKIDKQFVLDVDDLIQLNVDQFYGIEIEEFPARIAEVALWLTDHQMNMKVGQEFGSYFVRVPLRASPSILISNALRQDWSVCFGDDVAFDFIFGNPPFAGHKDRTHEQTQDLHYLWEDNYARHLDYCTGWYHKIANYYSGVPGRAALVSTNSVSQGETAFRLWHYLLTKGFDIDFAHRTFKWENEARGNAAVHCVIVGFSHGGLANEKCIYWYDSVDGEPTPRGAKTISPYLIDVKKVTLVEPRGSTRILAPTLPKVALGNMPSDDGGLVVKHKDRPLNDKIAMKYLRQYIGTNELLYNIPRWCLWLVDADPRDIRKSDFMKKRLKRVRQFRENSTAECTREKADVPHLFMRTPQPQDAYIAVPGVVSENRRWFTIGHCPPTTIASNLIYTAVDPSGFLFSVLSSSMFITWLRTIGGALESRLRFAVTVVYNTFPLPRPTDKIRKTIIVAGKDILDARNQYPDASLVDLYDPLSMPAELVKAHKRLDAKVDRLFRLPGRAIPKSNDARIECLFDQYEELVAAKKRKLGI